MTKSYKKETQHILNAINSDGFESEPYYNKCTTDKAKAKFSYGRFFAEYKWRVEQRGLQAALIDWLQGLALDIDYNNYDILENYKAWNHIETMTEREEDKILDNYWRFMSMRLIGLWRKHIKESLV